VAVIVAVWLGVGVTVSVGVALLEGVAVAVAVTVTVAVTVAVEDGVWLGVAVGGTHWLAAPLSTTTKPSSQAVHCESLAAEQVSGEMQCSTGVQGSH